MKRSIEDMHIAGYYSNAIMRCFAFSYCTGYDGRDGPISPLMMIDVGELKGYAANARTHPTSRIDQIARAIADSGFTNPLLIDEGNVIVAGHGRLAAAMKLGMAQVPCIRLAGLSKAQIKARGSTALWC